MNRKAMDIIEYGIVGLIVITLLVTLLIVLISPLILKLIALKIYCFGG